MTYQEFKNKYNGKYTDYDGYYGCQCWDLAQRYFVEVLGLPDSILSGCGLVSNMLYPPKRKELDKYFDEVSVYEMNTGDVCIWEYGHIAIFDNWDGVSCWYFSQNPNPCQIMQVNEGGLHAFRIKKSKDDVYNLGNYKTLYNMNVRENPSINSKIKKVKELTQDGKRNATSTNPEDNAVYKKGTIFTAKEIIKNNNYIWAKSPSGYICLEDSNTKYCEKV